MAVVPTQITQWLALDEGGLQGSCELSATLTNPTAAALLAFGTGKSGGGNLLQPLDIARLDAALLYVAAPSAACSDVAAVAARLTNAARAKLVAHIDQFKPDFLQTSPPTAAAFLEAVTAAGGYFPLCWPDFFSFSPRAVPGANAGANVEAVDKACARKVLAMTIDSFAAHDDLKGLALLRQALGKHPPNDADAADHWTAASLGLFAASAGSFLFFRSPSGPAGPAAAASRLQMAMTSEPLLVFQVPIDCSFSVLLDVLLDPKGHVSSLSPFVAARFMSLRKALLPPGAHATPSDIATEVARLADAAGSKPAQLSI
jgi:hypothetical protein